MAANVLTTFTVFVAIIVGTLLAFAFNTYAPSETRVPRDADAPRCYGVSFALDSDTMLADEPGKRVCFGYLDRS